MIFAYIRVSTELQSYEGQRYEIEQLASRRQWVIDKWVQEKASGTKALKKRTLDGLLKRMKKGDTLICTELSRLGRNMMMVMSILNTCSQKGIKYIPSRTVSNFRTRAECQNHCLCLFPGCGNRA